MTPFENKNSLVRFGYFVATLNLFFFLSLNSNAISSRSAIVWTSIQGSGIATTKSAFPKLNFLFTLIFFWVLISLSLNRSNPEKPISKELSLSLSIISLACKYRILIFFLFLIEPIKSLSPLSEIRFNFFFLKILKHLFLTYLCLEFLCLSYFPWLVI